MKVVWMQRDILPSELYAQLPADIPLTMIDVLTHLEHLQSKGILKKRMRSNEEAFSPLISRKDMFSFYLAAYTESMYQSKSDDDNGNTGMLLNDLKNKVILLSSDENKHNKK